MEVSVFTPSEAFGSNTYVIENSGVAAVIDPSVSYDEVIAHFETPPDFKYIIITHVHFDHMLEIDDWVKKTDADVIVGKEDAPAFRDSRINCFKLFFDINKTYDGSYVTVEEGDKLSLGDLNIDIISTPGHTKGSVSLVTSDSIFVGDVIFSKYSVGRCDLPGGDYPTLLGSIKRILSYPDYIKVYPGHGNSTTVYNIKN